MKKVILSILCCFLGFLAVQAEVTDVKFLVEYNDLTGLYDCKIVIMDGSATTYQHRILTEIHYVVVVPTGAECTIMETHNPLMDNKDYGGTVGFDWQFYETSISPSSQPENDFHLICPVGIDKATFNDLYAGDTITLFSVFSDIDPCENSVRAYENGVDHSGSGTYFYNKFKMYVGGEYIESLSSIYEKCPASDFNETFVDLPVTSNLNTNDRVSAGTTYGPSPMLVSKPAGSTEILQLNSDGTYTFTGDIEGTYTYEIPVCVDSGMDCLSSTLTIDVVDNLKT